MLNTTAFAIFAAILARGPSLQEGGGPASSGAVVAADGFPALSDGEILVLGETHGSNEIPQFVLQQVRRLARHRLLTIGLEIGPASAALDCRRAGPAGLPPGWRREAQDGRTSQAMRALLCALRAPPLARSVRVVFLDDEDRGDDFDARAARRFREVIAARGGIGLILTGNFHARNNAGSLAAQLRALGVSVRTVTVSAPVAETWICSGQASCGAQRSNINFCSAGPAAARELRWYPSPDPRFQWNYCLSMPRLTPSAPAMSNEAR